MSCHQDRLLAPGLTDWQQLGAWLQREGWESVVCPDTRALLLRDGTALLLGERADALRASQRRGLHRSGFRTPAGRGPDLTLWVWAPPPATTPGGSLLKRLERYDEEVSLCTDTAVHVLRDVLRLSLSSLLVLVADDEAEDDGWDDDLWDDDLDGVG